MVCYSDHVTVIGCATDGLNSNVIRSSIVNITLRLSSTVNITVRQMVWYSKGGQKTGLKKTVYGPKCPVRIWMVRHVTTILSGIQMNLGFRWLLYLDPHCTGMYGMVKYSNGQTQQLSSCQMVRRNANGIWIPDFGRKNVFWGWFKEKRMVKTSFMELAWYFESRVLDQSERN